MTAEAWFINLYHDFLNRLDGVDLLHVFQSLVFLDFHVLVSAKILVVTVML